MRRVNTQNDIFAESEKIAMFSKLQKNKLPLKIKLFNIRWYPSDRSCTSKPNRKANGHSRSGCI